MKGTEIILNDGTILQNGSIGYSDGVIWCCIKDENIVNMFALFADPEKTKHLEFHYGEMVDVYDGFTVIGAALQNENQAQIMLRKVE